MKKIVVTFLICMLLTACGTKCVTASTIITKKESEEVMVYSISRDVLREFLENPSINILQKENNDINISSYKKSNSQEGNIQRKIIKRDTIQIDESKSGIMRIGTLPVYSEFLDDIGTAQSIEKLLCNDGIKCVVEEYVLIECSTSQTMDIPITIWVKSNNGIYFITINETFNYENPQSTKFDYKVYTHNEYNNKFGLKNGMLKVNGKDISEGNYIKFEFGNAYLPFRAVMESLGAIVEWDEEQNRVLLTCNEKIYILETDNGLSLTELGQSSNILIPPPGGAYYYQIINDRIIMDAYTMQAVVNVMDAIIDIDYTKLSINISVNKN